MCKKTDKRFMRLQKNIPQLIETFNNFIIYILGQFFSKKINRFPRIENTLVEKR